MIQTIVANIEKRFCQAELLYLLANRYCESVNPSIWEITFNVEDADVSKISKVMTKYISDDALLNEILWYYTLIRTEAEAKPLSQKNDVEYAQLGKIIKSTDLSLGMQFIEKGLGKIQRITFEIEKGKKVEISSESVIQNLLIAIARDKLLSHVINEHRNKPKKKKPDEGTHRNSIAYYLFEFLKHHTSISDNQKHQFGANLMFEAGVRFPSNPKSFDEAPKTLEKNFKNWVISYQRKLFKK